MYSSPEGTGADNEVAVNSQRQLHTPPVSEVKDLLGLVLRELDSAMACLK